MKRSYPWKQVQHVVLGVIAGTFGLDFAVPFFGLWTLKEVFADNPANGGMLLVALDSFADLVVAAIGCLLVFAGTRHTG